MYEIFIWNWRHNIRYQSNPYKFLTIPQLNVYTDANGVSYSVYSSYCHQGVKMWLDPHLLKYVWVIEHKRHLFYNWLMANLGHLSTYVFATNCTIKIMYALQNCRPTQTRHKIDLRLRYSFKQSRCSFKYNNKIITLREPWVLDLHTHLSKQ